MLNLDLRLHKIGKAALRPPSKKKGIGQLCQID
jgi:hypothetical protein